MAHTDFGLDLASTVSLLVTVIFALVALASGHLVIGKQLPTVEKWILSWLVFDALIHFLLEGPFVVISLTGAINSSESTLAVPWKEYGKADARWLVSDPTIVSLELLTVVLDGALCIVTIAAIVSDSYYRHYVQIVLCVCELYGGWMTFCPEWLTGSSNLDTSNLMHLWLYLVFFNMVWVVVPLLLMYHSWLDMKTLYLSMQPVTKNAPVLRNKRGAKKDR